MLKLRRRRRGGAADLRRNDAGVSAVEFALVLPIMLVLLVGTAEMSHAIMNWRKVTLLARTVADLTAMGDTADPIGSATMSDILAASTAVMLPFPSTNIKIVVSALAVSPRAWSPSVCSSVATGNATARATGTASDLGLPSGYGAIGNRYLLAEVSVPYAPMVGGAFVKLMGGSSGTITLRTSFAWPVRNGYVHNSATSTPEITLPSGSPCP